MDIFTDDAFACFVMEQEGVFDCRTRQERMEAAAELLAKEGSDGMYSYSVQAEVFINCGLRNLTTAEYNDIIDMANLLLED